MEGTVLFRFGILLALAATLLVGAPASLAEDVTCPRHPLSTCWEKGTDCSGATCVAVYHCSCGDDVYVGR